MTAVSVALTVDAPMLAAIHAASFTPAWDAAAIAVLLESPGCFALWFPGEAFILLRTVLDEAEIITLAVVPARRRRGEARALLQAGAAACVVRGATTLHLEVAAGNAAALALYSSLGFRQSGCRPRYYADGGDALLWRLSLCEAAAARLPD